MEHHRSSNGGIGTITTRRVRTFEILGNNFEQFYSKVKEMFRENWKIDLHDSYKKNRRIGKTFGNEDKIERKQMFLNTIQL